MSGVPRLVRRSLPARGARRAALLGTALLGLGLVVVAPATAQATTITVGVAGPSCRGATTSSVAAAVAAAAPGAVITVCPGIYTGTVVISKPLTLHGAQHGVDARGGRTNLAKESIIDGGGAAGIQITGTTSGVTVDGFTIRNSGTDAQEHDGIEAFSGGSGFNFLNNVVTQTTYGINMSSLGTPGSTVARNRFDTNNRSGSRGGSGVFICCGPGNNLSITDNLFTGNNSAAVNTAGDGNRPSTGLKIQRNQSIDDATFAVVVNAMGASVSDNVVQRTTRATVAVGSALYIGGGTTGVQITRNTVSGGAATGIRVTNAFGPVNNSLVVSGNRIVGRSDGIRLTGQTSGSINTNDVAQSTDVGILLDKDNAGVTVNGNKVAGSKVLDCQDVSTGSRTAGTADTWTANLGVRAQPRGLCGIR
ncbi:MAG TPA: right-handed parallel beta-helix repeat-containing protein [Pseudonocardia sp.]